MWSGPAGSGRCSCAHRKARIAPSFLHQTVLLHVRNWTKSQLQGVWIFLSSPHLGSGLSLKQNHSRSLASPVWVCSLLLAQHCCAAPLWEASGLGLGKGCSCLGKAAARLLLAGKYWLNLVWRRARTSCCSAGAFPQNPTGWRPGEVCVCTEGTDVQGFHPPHPPIRCTIPVGP